MGLSGKSDFEDWCCMHNTPQEIIDKYQVFVGKHDLVPLGIRSEKDLVAYYPYLIGMICGSKDGMGIIHLSDESYIDIEEREHMQLKMDYVKKYYRRCKRKKQKFDKEEALKLIGWYEPYKQYETDIVERVAKSGEKASTERLHDPMHERMRNEWYTLMVDAGWDKDQAYRWVYGWRRWIEKSKLKEYGNRCEQQKLDIV